MDRQDYELKKQEVASAQERANQSREQFYRDNPELGQWLKRKKAVLLMLVIYWILHTVFSMIYMVQVHDLTNKDAVITVVRLLFQVFWLYVFMNPQGGWRINIILYFWALLNLGMLLTNISAMINNALPHVSRFPVLGIIMLMETLVPFLLLGVAVYLTVPPKHRMMSEQIEAFGKQMVTQIRNEAGIDRKN